jgi:hypothetical protein
MDTRTSVPVPAAFNSRFTGCGYERANKRLVRPGRIFDSAVRYRTPRGDSSRGRIDGAGKGCPLRNRSRKRTLRLHALPCWKTSKAWSGLVACKGESGCRISSASECRARRAWRARRRAELRGIDGSKKWGQCRNGPKEPGMQRQPCGFSARKSTERRPAGLPSLYRRRRFLPARR